MSKPVFVLLRETEGDNLHHGFAEFEGIYRTVKAAKAEWTTVKWTKDDDYGACYGGESRWTAKLRKGVTLVIEDYIPVAEP